MPGMSCRGAAGSTKTKSMVRGSIQWLVNDY
jgi:hypothetical protein